MIDSSILLKASRIWLVYNSYSSFFPLYLERGTMFTFFPVFWCLTCPPRALKEKCLYFWDGACKYVLRISLNMADLKAFSLTKLVLSLPEGGNGMWRFVDTPSCFQCSASFIPFTASHAGSLTQPWFVSCPLSFLQNFQPMSLKYFLQNSETFVWLQTVCITVKDILINFQLPARENKTHTVSVLPKIIYFQSARCFQLNEVFPYQCTSLQLQWFAWIKPGKKSPEDYYTQSVSEANEWSSSCKSRPRPHHHLDKLRNWKVITQVFYRAMCLGNEFQLSGLWGTELVWAGSAITLCGTRRFPPAWLALSSSAASRPTSGKLRSAQCSKSTWHCGTMQGVWDDVGVCKMLCKREEMTQAMAEGRWHYRDNREFVHRHIFAQAVESH